MQIIGISGAAGAGKDTAYELLSEHYTTHGLKCKKLSFAGKIKDICAILYGWDLDRLQSDAEYKEGDTLDDGSPDPACQMLGLNRREIMQLIGTEAFREKIHQDHWLITLKLAMMNGEYDDTDIGFVTDCRFLNELSFVKEMGGTLIRIEGSTLTQHSNHASELEWKQWDEWDVIVSNVKDSSISREENFKRLLSDLLTSLNGFWNTTQIPKAKEA